MAYASLPDVMALNTARVYTASSRPATVQVGQWLDQTAAILDSILLEKGYSLPVPSTASSALLLLQEANAAGAWLKVEAGAEASDKRDLSREAWQNALAMLKAANTVLDIPKTVTRATPRGPGVTSPNGVVDQPYDPFNSPFDSQGRPADSGSPLFTRSQQF